MTRTGRRDPGGSPESQPVLFGVSLDGSPLLIAAPAATAPVERLVFPEAGVQDGAALGAGRNLRIQAAGGAGTEPQLAKVREALTEGLNAAGHRGHARAKLVAEDARGSAAVDVRAWRRIARKANGKAGDAEERGAGAHAGAQGAAFDVADLLSVDVPASFENAQGDAARLGEGGEERVRFAANGVGFAGRDGPDVAPKRGQNDEKNADAAAEADRQDVSLVPHGLPLLSQSLYFAPPSRDVKNNLNCSRFLAQTFLF
jgi:hypothetical protein